ncbi:hypothetical protein [Clostridioides difficile]|uniref:hypothetical protein n=1 Tax=Clostridioides difficile TaxID=1496 RepID=UPI001F2532E6|nr:hypothetical protein [Clostridioides difficile]
MFNFIIYDRENESIFGARDLFGIKPLYYINKENAIIFSSSLYSILLESLVLFTDSFILNLISSFLDISPL